MRCIVSNQYNLRARSFLNYVRTSQTMRSIYIKSRKSKRGPRPYLIAKRPCRVVD